MTRRAPQRRGVALAAALVALTIIAALGAGALAASRVADRTSRDAAAVLRATTAAFGALDRVRHPWDVRRNQLAIGGIDTIALPSLGSATVQARIGRLDATRFLVEATAQARAASPGAGRAAERTASALVRLIPSAPTPRGAITLGGTLTVATGATVDGTDGVPSGWGGCPPPSSPYPSVAAGDARDVDAAGATIVGAVQGTPAALDVTIYETFGAERYGDVASRATIDVAANGTRAPQPAADTSGCLVAADAWGEPRRGAGSVASCHASFPIVHARGDLTLRGPARGQGTLLVDGDLTVDGLVTFAGVVVVRGALRAGAASLQLDGALFAARGASALGTGSRVRWSSCAYARARDGAARVTFVGRRTAAIVTR